VAAYLPKRPAACLPCHFALSFHGGGSTQPTCRMSTLLLSVQQEGEH